MTDRVLVEALRSRDPGALAALYDSYAESIYQFCLYVLGSADGAQVALRDTLIAAEANVHALTDPDRLGPWLLSFARLECDRRRAGAARGGPAPEPPAPDGDHDQRLIAWRAAWSLPADDRRLLYLATRHDLTGADIAQIVGASPRAVQEAHEGARLRLRDAVTAEILALKGPFDCPRRARILGPAGGEVTPQAREQLLRHLDRCDTCAPHRDRRISAAKVFAALPAQPLPATLRVRLMSCFTDPELMPYRRYVARRVGLLDARGFPAGTPKGARRWPQTLAGAAAAVAAVIAVMYAFTNLGAVPGGTIEGFATHAFPSPGEPPAVRLPWYPEPEKVPVQLERISDRARLHDARPVPFGVAGPARDERRVPPGLPPAPVPAPAHSTHPAPPPSGAPSAVPPLPTPDHQTRPSTCPPTARPAPTGQFTPRPPNRPTVRPTGRPTHRPTHRPTKTHGPRPRPRPHPTRPTTGPTPTPTPTVSPTASPSPSG